MALRSEPIEFIDDDDFGSLRIVRRVVFSITRKFQSASMVGVFGARGSGRTSLMNLCKNFAELNPLSAEHKISMWLKPFESWRLAGMGNLTQALLWHIHKNLPEIAAKDEKVLYKLGRISVALSTLTGNNQSSGFTQVSSVESVRNFDLISKSLSPERKSAVSSQFSACELIDELSELFSSLGKQLCALCGCNVFVVPVDDLDKCTPEEALQLLFALRIMITGESFSFVVAADKNILSKFCNYVYGSMFTDSQTQDLLLSFFNDWVYLPSPPLLALLKKVDFPLSVRDEFFRELETTGLAEVFPITSPVIRGCKRFELFIYGEASNAEVTVSDYCVWLGWFLISEINPELIQRIIQSDNPEEFFARYACEENCEEKPDTTQNDSNKNHLRISIGHKKPKKRLLETSGKDDLLCRFQSCMSGRMSTTELVKKLRYIYPFL
ncbi:MAG TPA: P-loop NTPase fold protein [Chitinispirillaceae bacterium]|nr:P-loop NTPase fold protein [Chitinispirillaceae bacterium]